MMGPDFVGVGAPRSGTSWLYEVLAAIPGCGCRRSRSCTISTSRCSSKRYYSYLRMRLISGLWIRHPLSRFDLQYFLGRRSDAWYCNLFAAARRRGLLTGEITPAYSILDEPALQRLRALNPEVKLIYVMRDPVMRSWSAVMKRRRKRGLTGMSRAARTRSTTPAPRVSANGRAISKRSSGSSGYFRATRSFTASSSS